MTFFYSVDILILKGRGKVEENIDNKNEVDSSIEQNKKKDKASLILFIVATVLLTIAVILTILFASMTIAFFNAESEEQLGAVIGLAIYMAYFGIPAIILGGVSFILNIVAVSLTKKLRALKIVFIILSFVIVMINVVLFICIQAGN